MPTRTNVDPKAKMELPRQTGFDLELDPRPYGFMPVCRQTTAERFRVEAGSCAVSDAMDCGILAARITGGTCLEARSCLLGMTAVGDGIENRLKAAVN